MNNKSTKKKYNGVNIYSTINKQTRKVGSTSTEKNYLVNWRELTSHVASQKPYKILSK